ncbi:MAG: carboxypeptidase-like regulatory domain-containing protein [Bacteroides sp.]|nr:carboxypeptidase-like regulatory domain-containing protein [Bacteroides sp.]
MKTRKLFLLAFLSGSLAPLATSCKTTTYDSFGEIYGTVCNSSTNEPIEGALVTLSPGAKTYMTLLNGSFTFKELDIEQYTLTVQKEGYSTNRKIITPVAGQGVEAIIFLAPRQ